MLALKLITDSIIQVNDLIRFDASKIVTDEEIVTVEVKAFDADSYVDITQERYLDYAYENEGNFTISLRVTTDIQEKTLTKDIIVLTEEEDRLFSDDSDLLAHEEDIYNLLPIGRNSFNYAHRLAQKHILLELLKKGYKVEKDKIFSLDEVKNWSKYLTLSFIFESNIKREDDIHIRKKELYQALADEEANNTVIRLDLDKDGTPDAVMSTRPLKLRLQ